jgi:peptide/nickel transport system ATP-binding protein
MVMYAGKIAEGAGTDELFAAMRHPYSEALLSSIPRLTQDRTQRLYSIPGLPPDLSHDIVGCRFSPRCRYATEQCRVEEPLLAPSTSAPSPSSGVAVTDTPSVLGANPAGEHVVACFHPVGVSTELGGAGSGLAAAQLDTFGYAPVAPGAEGAEPDVAADQAGLLAVDIEPSGAMGAGDGDRAGTGSVLREEDTFSQMAASFGGPAPTSPGSPGSPEPGGAPAAAAAASAGNGAGATAGGDGNRSVTASPRSAGDWAGDAARRVQVSERGPGASGDWAPGAGDPFAGVPIVLELDHLVKEYPVTSGAVVQRKIGTVKAVSDVSFAVHRGETFGLVGESGCGKTTIGRLVVALERPTGGEVRFDGQTVSSLHGGELRARRRDLQLMFQDPYASLDPRMRVGSIVSEPLVVQKIGSRPERRSRVNQLLGEVGLASRSAALYPHEFSGGQRQRIGLARALALNPRLIVADEPVSALDVSIQAQILNLMRSLQEKHGLTYIVISHDLAVIKYLADTIGVMYLGKLVEVGPANDVYAHTAHPYTQGLIDTIPVPDPVLARGRKKEAVRGELPSAISPPSGCRFRTRCPLAQDVCAEVEPPMIPFGPRHYAACHFPLQNPVGTPAPATAGVASASS